MASGNIHCSPREIPTIDFMDTAIEMAMASLFTNTRRCYVNHYLDFLKFIKSKFPNDNLFPVRNAQVITYLA